MIGRTLARALERHPGRLLIVAGVITLALLPGVFRLRFRGDLVDLLPRGQPAARELGRYARTFGRSDPITVLVTGGDPVRLTDFADRFARTAARVRGVRSVEVRLRRSMTSSPDEVFRLLDDSGFARARTLLGDAAIDESVRRGRALLLQPGAGAAAGIFRADPLELRRLLTPAYARLGAGLSVDPSSGYFLSPRGDGLVALVRTSVDAFSIAPTRALLRGLRRAAQRARPGPLVVQMTGAHTVAEATARMIRSDLTRSSTLSTLLVLCVFALAFGRVRALFAVGPPLALGALWTAGMAGYVLGQLNAISVAFAAILLGLGDDLATHLYLAIDDRAHQGLGAREAAAQGTRALLSPTLIAATTGSLGFLALARSDFVAVRDLGLLSAGGILLTAVAVVLITPAVMALRGPAAAEARPISPIDQALGGAGAWLSRHTLAVGALSIGCLAAAALVGPPPFAREVVGVRPRALEPLKVQRELFARFGGEPGQVVALVRGRSLPVALEKNDALAVALTRLEERGAVAGWSSLATLFPSPRTQEERLRRREALDLPRVATTLEDRLSAHGFARAPFATTLAALRRPSSTIVLPSSSSDPLFVERHLRRTGGGYELATYVRPGRGGPTGLARALARAVPGVRVTGYPLFEAEVRRLLPADLLRVGSISILLVAATLLFHFRQPGPALLAVGSVAVGIAWMFLLAIPLGISWTAYNLIVVPVLIGISIDENVFLIHRYLEGAGEPAARVGDALREGGRAVLTTASTTAAGFATLTLCQFDGLRSLGVTAALGIVACLLASLVVTPALLPLLATRGASDRRS